MKKIKKLTPDQVEKRFRREFEEGMDLYKESKLKLIPMTVDVPVEVGYWLSYLSGAQNKHPGWIIYELLKQEIPEHIKKISSSLTEV